MYFFSKTCTDIKWLELPKEKEEKNKKWIEVSSHLTLSKFQNYELQPWFCKIEIVPVIPLPVTSLLPAPYLGTAWLREHEINKIQLSKTFILPEICIIIIIKIHKWSSSTFYMNKNSNSEDAFKKIVLNVFSMLLFQSILNRFKIIFRVFNFFCSWTSWHDIIDFLN